MLNVYFYFINILVILQAVYLTNWISGRIYGMPAAIIYDIVSQPIYLKLDRVIYLWKKPEF